MQNKKSAKIVMEPHSKAKVEFYQKYIERYLSILVQSKYINSINIYDVFCGRGVYEDGGIGSPLRAFNTIKSIDTKGKSISLFLNDIDKTHISNVRAHIDPLNQNNCICNVIYSNNDAEIFLDSLVNKLNNTARDTRNLIFIDPYGYKHIHKEILNGLLQNRYTEILLFLPIHFMYRFKNCALHTNNNVNNESFKPLRGFIDSFFPDNHPIRKQEKISALDCIQYLTQAFSFDGKYYTTSYHIERSANCYFAVFFFSSHIVGFNKILEVKWNLDEDDGNGFKKTQPGLFDELDAEEKKQQHYYLLKEKLIEFLSEVRTNQEIFKFILRNEYLPKHATPILKELQNNNRLIVKDPISGEPIRKSSFFLTDLDKCVNFQITDR